MHIHRIQMQLQSQSRGPSGNKLLLRMHGISLVIHPILGGLDLILRSLLAHSLPPNHFPLGIFSWFSIHIHNLMERILEIPFWNLPCWRSANPSSRNIIGIWFPFLLGGILSYADGSIGPRAQ
jgi:hypothetical protein